MAINNSSSLSIYRKAINGLETLINNVNTSLTNSINTVKNTYLSLSGGGYYWQSYCKQFDK